MSNQPAPKPWTRSGIFTALLFALYGLVLLLGCIPVCIMVPGTSCQENILLFENKRSSNKPSEPPPKPDPCKYKHNIKHAEKTPYGWIGVYSTEAFCDDKKIDPPDKWSIVGFLKSKPEKVRNNGSIPYQSYESALRIDGLREIKNVKVSFSAPYWLHISADVGFVPKPQSWSFLFSNNGNIKVSSIQCDNIFSDENLSVATCLGSPGRSWENIASELNDPTIFDKDALNWLVNNRDDPAEVIHGLAYFADTQNKASTRRTHQTNALLLDFIDNFDCSDLLVLRQWKDYLTAIDVILTPERKASVLERCTGPLDAEQRIRLKRTQTPFITPKTLQIIDARMLAQIKASEAFSWSLWLERLDELPAPSAELVALIDQYFFEQLPDSDRYLKKRLTHPNPISPANVTLLLKQTSAESIANADLISAIFARPEMAEHRDALDQVWLDAMSDLSIPDSAREMFKLRMTTLNTHPLSASNFERLQNLLVNGLDQFTNEAVALLEQADEAQRNSLLKRFDAHVASHFPSGSAFFLIRLSDDSLPRTEPDITDTILDKAQAMKNNGTSFEQAPCEVVCRLMFLPISEDECVLPDNL